MYVTTANNAEQVLGLITRDVRDPSAVAAVKSQYGSLSADQVRAQIAENLRTAETRLQQASQNPAKYEELLLSAADWVRYSKELVASQSQFHTVKSGDTLWAISEKYLGAGGRYTEICPVNKESWTLKGKAYNPDLIFPGMVFQIPSKPSFQTYTVAAGDNLTKIAKKFYPNLDNAQAYRMALQIAKDNGIANPDLIRAGQQLKIGGGAPAEFFNEMKQIEAMQKKVSEAISNKPVIQPPPNHHHHTPLADLFHGFAHFLHAIGL